MTTNDKTISQEQLYKRAPRPHATREEFFNTAERALSRINFILERIQPVVDAENKYLTHTATEMGIRRHHITDRSEFFV